jgi:hypothetical protein
MDAQSRLSSRRLYFPPDEKEITEEIEAHRLSLRFQVGDGCFHELAILAN